MLTHPEGEVLGVNAEGVEADRLEQGPASHALVAAVGVGEVIGDAHWSGPIRTMAGVLS